MDPPEIKNKKPFLIRQINSFGFALDGLFYSFRKGTHFKIETAALVLITILGFIYQINTWEWLAIILISAAILGSEAINTAIEELSDVLHPEHHPRIRLAKHCAAAGVLILSVAALIIALVIFLPKIFG